MLWHHKTRVNSHQVRFCVCFHLWCELTLALWCHSIVWSQKFHGIHDFLSSHLSLSSWLLSPSSWRPRAVLSTCHFIHFIASHNGQLSADCLTLSHDPSHKHIFHVMWLDVKGHMTFPPIRHLSVVTKGNTQNVLKKVRSQYKHCIVLLNQRILTPCQCKVGIVLCKWE